jgi:FkbM family methyltransferase
MEYESKVTQVAVQGEGRSIPLLLFDNPMSIEVTTSIVEGKTYPLVGFLKNVNTIVDVGANIGAASVFFALNYPQARIFAFEPCPHTYLLLARNTSVFSNVKCFDYGLLDRDCQASLHLGQCDAVTNSVAESCLNSGRSVQIRLADIRKAFSEHAIEKIDILKIDTEGCEVPIVEAIADSLDRIQVIYLEYHDEGDRRTLDRLLSRTHLLFSGKIPYPHRGELCYVAYSSFPSREERDRLRICSDTVRRSDVV